VFPWFDRVSVAAIKSANAARGLQSEARLPPAWHRARRRQGAAWPRPSVLHARVTASLDGGD